SVAARRSSDLRDRLGQLLCLGGLVLGHLDEALPRERGPVGLLAVLLGPRKFVEGDSDVRQGSGECFLTPLGAERRGTLRREVVSPLEKLQDLLPAPGQLGYAGLGARNVDAPSVTGVLSVDGGVDLLSLVV